MDKYEYKVRAEEIKTLIAEGEFAEAVKIADTIDWRRVKSVMMLCTISDLYKINRRFQESKDILLLAYERHPGGRLIVYSLCELSVKMGEFVQAIEYYKEFVQIAPKDTGRYILQYKLYEAQDVSLEERIAVLEEFKKRDYREKWAYELAYLYHRVGLETKCVEECDEMFVWFGEGRYVLKAMELKMLHQPLTPVQQDKYLLMKEELERQLLGHMEEEPEEEAEELSAEELEEQQLAEEEEAETDENGKIMEFSRYTQPEEDESDEEFRVKTVDVGQYNTINLQAALAESMKELLGEEEPEADADLSEEITQSIVAPLLQDTEDISQVRTAAFAAFPEEPAETESAEPEASDSMDIMEVQPQEPEDIPVQIPEPETATEEVFFEEDVKDVLLEDTKEINIGDALESNLNDTKELNPKRRVVYPTYTPNTANSVSAGTSAAAAETSAVTAGTSAAAGTSAVTVGTAGTAATSVTAGTAATVAAAVTAANTVQSDSSVAAKAQGSNLMRMNTPSGYEQMLSQEYDGQISLVVPDKSDIERQITGQMNINDIMAEWERMKRENEEKRREDVRKRVQQHTGNLFSEFDEATKTGLLEQLEKAVVEAILKESGEKPVNPNDITPERLTDIVKNVEKNKENSAKQSTGSEDMAASGAPEPITSPQEVAAREMAASAPEDEEIAKPVLTDTGILDLERIILETTDKKLKAADENSSPADNNKTRALTDEEKELFGRFVHNRKVREQIVNAVDAMSMDSYSGNVIVTGEEEAGTLEVAKGMVRMLQLSDANFSGKVAKISGNTLNKKNVQEIVSKLVDGALIIEHATAMSSSTAADLNKALAKENSGLFVVMEGKKDEMNIFLRKNFSLMDNFNARVDIESLDDQTLVEYAREYAEEMEYSIDELGILALHTRIADMQTSDHEVTVAEVRELVDDAIYFADKKNPKHFLDILFGKRYDEEDMIILREKDFMHY